MYHTTLLNEHYRHVSSTYRKHEDQAILVKQPGEWYTRGVSSTIGKEEYKKSVKASSAVKDFLVLEGETFLHSPMCYKRKGISEKRYQRAIDNST